MGCFHHSSCRAASAPGTIRFAYNSGGVNITITGGTGFIGRRLVARLLAGNHSLHLLVRHARIGLGPQVQCSIWNALDIEPAPESLAEADAVIHLAGEPVSQRWTPAAKRRILESRVEGTRRLIEALSRQSRRPSVLVCASAVGFYGSRGDAILTESAAAGEGFLSDVCTVWEKTADAALNLGMRVVKLRTGMTLGKEGGALAQMLTPFRWGVGGKVASGEQWVSWIHVDDLVELIQFAVENAGLRGPAQRHGAQSGHERPVHQGTGGRASPPSVPEHSCRGSSRSLRGDGGDRAGQPARGPAGRPLGGLSIPLPRSGRGAAPTAGLNGCRGRWCSPFSPC